MPPNDNAATSGMNSEDANQTNVPQDSSNSQNSLDQPSTPEPVKTAYTGLTGNELYCMYLCGYRPGNLVVGNSVYAMGFIGGMASNVRTTIGGEIKQFTNMIAEGRRLSIQRMEGELNALNGCGGTGVSSELVFHPGNIEFLAIGSAYHRQDGQKSKMITSSADGQEFFCQVDAGYYPVRFAFGNVAYSVGVGRNLIGEMRELVKGEISEYSNVFNVTRNLALQRIVEEAKLAGANSVIGIRTTIVPIGSSGVQEMVMIGTASYNPAVSEIAESLGGVITSDMTAEETWNITRLGYVPLRLILATSVYSLGVVGGIRAAVHGFVKGELTTLTQMIYGAREESLKKVQRQAEEIGADDVLGIKTYIYQLGGDVLEFLVVGTAVKRYSGMSTRSDQLPPQAVIRNKKTFINTAEEAFSRDLNDASVGRQQTI